LVTAVVAVALVAGIVLVCGARVFSPGDLHAEGRRQVPRGGVAAHTEIESCSACHAPPWGGETMTNRCLACHDDIRTQIESRSPLHGTMPDGGGCRDCHTEHQGARAQITRLDRFHHDFAAFRLTGKHTALECASCHVAETYKGTPQSCAACHTEPAVHKGRFGTACAQCHSTHTWRDMTVTTAFDHDLAAFPLTGKHRTVDCKACHINNVFASTPQRCVACHSEPVAHRGKYGTDCAACHSTTTFTGAIFKHSFPINHGRKKAGNPCTTCHRVPNTFATYTCYGCHEHQPTRIEKRHQRVKLGGVPLERCAQCHKGGRSGGERVGLLDMEPQCPAMVRPNGMAQWDARLPATCAGRQATTGPAAFP
jgi:hypothetical protein